MGFFRKITVTCKYFILITFLINWYILYNSFDEVTKSKHLNATSSDEDVRIYRNPSIPSSIVINLSDEDEGAYWLQLIDVDNLSLIYSLCFVSDDNAVLAKTVTGNNGMGLSCDAFAGMIDE